MTPRPRIDPVGGQAADPSPPPAALNKAAAALSDAVGWLTAEQQSTSPASSEAESHEKKKVVAVLRGVTTGIAAGAKAGGKGAVVGSTFLADLLTTTAARLPLRDKVTLLQQHPTANAEEIADSLEVAAARVCAAIGGAAGGLAAAQWLATPSLLAVPVELAAETLLVAAVELKLVAELHEIYDARPPGELGDRTAAYLRSWTAQRGLRGDGHPAGLAAQLASAGSAALRKRITGRLTRNLGSFLPFLAGAVIGARTNFSSTRKLSSRLRADLASHHPQIIPSQRIIEP